MDFHGNKKIINGSSKCNKIENKKKTGVIFLEKNEILSLLALLLRLP